MNPKQPPSLAEFGDRIARHLSSCPDLGAYNLRALIRHNKPMCEAGSQHLARLVLDLVDAFRAQNRADEPAESAHR